MSLVEVPVRGLHQGVSRQPDHTRLVGQLQDAENLLFRVEQSGFTKRFGSEHVGVMAAHPIPAAKLPFHVMNLGVNEQYGVTMYDGAVHIVNLGDGSSPTITIDPISAAYISSHLSSDYTFTTILDYTFVACRNKTVALKADLSADGINAVVFQVAGGRAGTYKITVDGHTGTRTTSATVATEWDTSNIAAALVASFGAVAGYNISIIQGSFIVVWRNDNAAMVSSASDAAGGKDIVMTNTSIAVTSSDKLPAFAIGDMIVTIGADTRVGSPKYYLRFVTPTPGAGPGFWEETVKPGIQVKLDPATMPQTLIRNGDGTFTLAPFTWDDQLVGDKTTVPNPDFVGKVINSITVFRDRLTLLSGEHVWCSATGEYGRFWPKFSTISLDNDPFGIRGTAGRVNNQESCIPYRKVLWTTSDEDQFELTSDSILTPKKAVLDGTTSYAANTACLPVRMAQMLYFTAFSNSDAIVYEYNFDALTLTSLATEITKHVRGYVPGILLDLTADQATGTLLTRSFSDPASLYVWTVFWNGQERAQSSWSKWTFGGSIHGAHVVGGALYLLIDYADGLIVERVKLADGTPSFPYAPRLDRQVGLTGTYNAGTDTSTFTLPYPALGAIAVLPDGSNPIAVSAVGNNITFAGNHTSARLGFTYDSRAVLSKQYHRDEKGTAILNGKLRLNQMTVSHKGTGYYEVHVAAPGRTTDVFQFTGRVLGVSDVGVQQMVEGTFQKGGLNVDGVDGTISIHNNTHLPHSINEIVFRGEFNELVRQG